MTLTDIEEYSLRLNNVLDCTIYNQITVGNVTLPKAVLSTVKIFAVHLAMKIPDSDVRNRDKEKTNTEI